MSAPRNTKKKVGLRFMIFPSNKGLYTAVCFELGLVREGKNPLKLKWRIESLAKKYIKSIRDNNLSEDLLNQSLPAKYEKKYQAVVKAHEEQENYKKWQKAYEALIWELRNGKKISLTIK